ncbi:MAG: MAPEG family protein [Rhodobacteraceae bacterium]|nr:MAG: MAPEG family protein [Paracoccaceae bacterium]
MTPELTALALAALLQIGQIALMAIPANLELGTAKTLSPRDPGRMDKPLMEQVSPRTGRLYRAMNNHFESLLLFAIATLTVTFADKGSGLTAAACGLYLVARLLYIPAYAFGWVPWRSVFWALGLLAILILLAAALL